MRDLKPTIIRIDQPPRAGHQGYVAALEVDILTGIVVTAAPILRWTIGKRWDDIKERGRKWGWKLDRLKGKGR